MAKAKTSRPDSSATKPVATIPFDKLYWTRAGLGVAAGALAYFISTLDAADSLWNGLTVALGFYLVSYYVARYAMYRKLGREYFSKFYTTGIGVFILIFLFTWILLFTYVHYSGSI